MAQVFATAPFQGSENNIRFALNCDWDVGTLEWIKSTGGSGGGPVTIADGADVAQGAKADVAWVAGDGTVISLLKKIASAGGSAVSIADGADIVEGALADAAVVTDAAGTVSGKLRGLIKWAFERMPASLGQKAMAASLPVVIASDQSSIPVAATPAASATATQSAVADSATSVTILASNSARLGASVANDSTVTLYLRLSATAATTTAYTVAVVANAYYEVPFRYTGAITGIWASDPNTGAARVTEFTA